MKKTSVIFIVMAFILLIAPVTVHAERPLSGFSVLLENIGTTELYTQEDLELLANCMYWENFWNGDYIMLLTGSVVLNRVNHCSWCPDDIKGVLYQKGQYSTVNKFFTRKIPDEVYGLAKQLLIFGSICPKNTVFQAMFPQGSGIYYQENGEYFCFE